MGYKVYVKVEYPDKIIAVEQGENLTSVRHWVLIDEGEGDRYRYAKEQYLEKPVTGEYGVAHYKLIDARSVNGKLVAGKAVERTKAEIAEDMPIVDIAPAIDPDVVLAEKIRKAKTLDELKAAFLGDDDGIKVKAIKHNGSQ